MFSEIIESGQPSEDPRAFRRCLGQFATGVAVMTAHCDSQLAGMSVNSFAALSMDPALVLWSIRKESASLPLYRNASHYAVNILSVQQADTSMHFANPASDKFARIDWDKGLGGAPLIHGCIAHLECALHQVIEGGDHFILVGQVERYTRYQGEPLLFAQGRYAVVQEFPAATPTIVAPTSDKTGLPFESESASFMRLANYAAKQLTSNFEAYRAQLDLSIAQIRLLGWLRTQHYTQEELAGLTYIGLEELKYALQDMLQSGQVQLQDGTYALTPEGHSKANAIASNVASFEKRLFANISCEEQQEMRSALLSLAHLTMSP